MHVPVPKWLAERLARFGQHRGNPATAVPGEVGVEFGPIDKYARAILEPRQPAGAE